MEPLDFDERMVQFDHTYPNGAENVAAEQALLEYAESHHLKSGFLRFWHPTQLMVVVGRGGRVEQDVFLDNCYADGVPVIRRISGGGTIVGGPGCLMFTVVLSLETHPGLRDIAKCHQWIGRRMQQAYLACGCQVELQGHSDLCIGDRKFSGNAMRLGRTHLIYHGTLLIDFELELIPKYLKFPSRKPEYRGERNHLDFVTNLPVALSTLKEEITLAFEAVRGRSPLKQEKIDELVIQRYGNRDWNLKL